MTSLAPSQEARLPRSGEQPANHPGASSRCDGRIPTSYLLDVSALMALLWETHVHNERVRAWEAGQQIQNHGMQLATLDEGIKHKAAFVIPA